MCVRSVEYWRAMTPSDQVGANPPRWILSVVAEVS
jgi:hypothetical protein